MQSVTIPAFISGVHNLIDPENIPLDAAQDASNFFTKDGREILIGGRSYLGASGAVGKITGLHIGYTTLGTSVIYRKAGTVIQYYDGTTWQTSISGLAENDDYVFTNYSSLAGACTYVNGPAAYYHIINTHPASPINVYNSSKNFYGYILIDRGRTLLWNRSTDKTGLYGSWIDRQDSTVYTTVAGEVLGPAPGPNYVGTLAFKGGGARRSCFGLSVSSTVGAGTETFVDNLDGTLTSNFGGTGTINYSTGAYNITFSAVTLANAVAGYRWQDPAVKGVADFTKSSPRVASEGFVFPQDVGGDPILNVLVGQDGNYYSMKEKSAYILSLDADDLGATNEVYRKEIGLPFFRAAASSNKGTVFLNTVNPTKPELTILQRNVTGTSIEPKVLFKHFKFENYNYDDACITPYDRWVVLMCRTLGATNNDTMLMCDLTSNKVDIVGYSGRVGVTDGAAFYVGDSITKSTINTFDGFDDLTNSIDAFWTSKDHTFSAENLKKTRRLRFKGFIDPDQSVKVYTNLDEAGFTHVGTIWGGASYVNYNNSQAIGANFVGEAQIGGDDITNAYGYFMEIKVRTGKYRKISVKLEPTEIGYFDFDTITFWDNLVFEDRLPKANRQKQNVSLNGQSVDQ